MQEFCKWVFDLTNTDYDGFNSMCHVDFMPKYLVKRYSGCFCEGVFG